MAAITETDFQNIRIAVNAYTDEAYTDARRIGSTGVVDRNPDILDPNSESYIGQMRWFKPLNPTINLVSLTDPTAGTTTGIATEVAKYIKSMRAFGGDQVNLQRVVSQADGLAKLGRDFSHVQAEDENAAVWGVLKGVAQSEVDRVAGTGTGLVDFDTDADVSGGNANGFFVDVNADGVFGAAATGAGDARPLVDASAVGAKMFARLFQAVGMAWKDYEPPYYYMATDPATMADLRIANLVDSETVTDGNLVFETVFGGRFRLLPTRANQGNWSADAAVNAESTKTTFIMGPGAVALAGISLSEEERLEYGRNPSAYKGGGSNELWYRWGYIPHPSGYDWGGAEDAFADDTALAAAGSYVRKLSALNLSILPIFHS